MNQVEEMSESSVDSSIYAWSEDGHKRHIESKRLKRRSTIKNRHRSTPIVNGALILPNNVSTESALLKRRAPTKAMTMALATSPPHRHLKFGIAIASPSQMSIVSSIASPLNKFPTAPSRSSSGSLTDDTGTPTTARPDARVPSYHGLRNGPLVVKNRVSTIPQLRIEDITLDTASLVASHWNVDQSSSQATPSVTASELIDNMLVGVQLGTRCNNSFPSSETYTFDDTVESEWATEDADMTPRLRGRWEEVSPVATTFDTSKSIAQTGSSESATINTTRSAKRQSVHLVSTPRFICRKSRFYPRPIQDAHITRSLAQQHLQVARGKYWCPLNDKTENKNDEMLLTPRQMARRSTRFIRRSGQTWNQPKTIIANDDLKVVVYPPEVDRSHLNRKRITVKFQDPNRTPTQATFKRISIVQSRISPSSSSSSSGHAKSKIPPPSTCPPPVPNRVGSKTLRRTSARKGRLSGRSYKSQSCLSCSCSMISGTCSCTSATPSITSYCDTSSSCQTCTCSDLSYCTCTASRFSTLGGNRHSTYFEMQKIPPRSAPLDTSIKLVNEYPEAPKSAPYYSSLNPPILNQIPHFSPLCIDFSHIFDIHNRRSKRLSRMDDRLSSCSCFTGTTCTSLTNCSECNRLDERASSSSSTTSQVHGELDITNSASYDTIRSASSSLILSPLSDTDSDNSSGQESEPPLTPPRSEYIGDVELESPGYRYSYVVSPISSQSTKKSTKGGCDLFDQNAIRSKRLSTYPTSYYSGGRVSRSTASIITVRSATNSAYTNAVSVATSKVPRSILKTSSKYRASTEMNTRRARSRRTSSIVSDSVMKKRINPGNCNTSTIQQHIKIDQRTLNPECRIQREEKRRVRNESRLYTLDRLEGKKAKKAGLLLQLSHSAKSSLLPRAQAWQQEQEEEEEVILSASHCTTPQTSLTDANNHLGELQRQYEIRQQALQLANKKNTMTIHGASGFDMGTVLRLPESKKKEGNVDDHLKTQIKSLSNSIEARLVAKEKCIDK